jgi:hypothetical protein
LIGGLVWSLEARAARNVVIVAMANKLERIRIKIRMYLDPAPARQHNCQPTTRFLGRRRFVGGQLHLYQPASRRNWSTPSLPTPLLQMAIESAEAQTSTLAKLAPPHTTPGGAVVFAPLALSAGPAEGGSAHPTASARR